MLWKKKQTKGVIITRYVPGPQSHFSLYLDGDQNKEDTVFTYVVDYGIYIHTSRPIQFCCFPNENFEKNAQEPARIPETWIHDPKGVLQIFTEFKLFHRRKPLSYKTFYYGQPDAILRSALAHHVMPESTFEDKTPEGMEHV